MDVHRLNITIDLYNQLEILLKNLAKRANIIENIVLIVSVSTSGGLWLLAAQALPQQTAWAGAALSTLTTGLTIYLYSSGVNKKRKKAIDLHSEVSIFLAKIRGNPSMSDEDFWEKFKTLETRIRTLNFEHE